MRGVVQLKGCVLRSDGDFETSIRVTSSGTMGAELRRFLDLVVRETIVDMELTEDGNDLTFHRRFPKDDGSGPERHELTVTYEVPFRKSGDAVPVRIDSEAEGGLLTTIELRGCIGPLADAALNLFRTPARRVMASDDGRMICIWDARIDPDYEGVTE